MTNPINVEPSKGEWCDMCDGTGLMEGWNRRDGFSCPKCKGTAVMSSDSAPVAQEGVSQPETVGARHVPIMSLAECVAAESPSREAREITPSDVIEWIRKHKGIANPCIVDGSKTILQMPVGTDFGKYVAEMFNELAAESSSTQIEALTRERAQVREDSEKWQMLAEFWEREVGNFRRNAAFRADQLAEEKVKEAESKLSEALRDVERYREALQKLNEAIKGFIMRGEVEGLGALTAETDRVLSQKEGNNG